MEPKTSRRIVSKEEYSVQMRKKVIFAGLGVTIFLMGLIAFPYGYSLINQLQTSYPILMPDDMIEVAIIAVIPFALLICGLCAVAEAKETDVGIPLTRFNTADLPAPETLVRASSEPMQEGMLLRAAAEGQETPPTELMRSVEKQE